MIQCKDGKSSEKGRFEQRENWRAKRVSQRTILWLDVGTEETKDKRLSKRFRNPILLARELLTTIELEDLSRADLARKLGCSRARVTQLLNLLNLPQELQLEIRSMGDNWDRQRVTERQLRRRLTD